MDTDGLRVRSSVGERGWLEVGSWGGKLGGGLEFVGMGNGIFDMGGFVEVWCLGGGGDVREARESLFSCLFGGGREVMLGFLVGEVVEEFTG